MNTIVGRGTRRERARGFTLIELMVVIAIIGILAAVVVPKFMGSLDDAKVRAAQAQITTFKTCLVAYKIKVGKFPTTGEGLKSLISNSSGTNFLEVDNVPADPWGNQYIYTSPGSKGHDFEIVSYGDDGQPGGDKYAADITSYDMGNKPTQ